MLYHVPKPNVRTACSTSFLNHYFSSLNTLSTVGDGSSLHGVGGGIGGGGNGVAIARLLLSGSMTALDVRELARLLSITSSAKLSDSVKP